MKFRRTKKNKRQTLLKGKGKKNLSRWLWVCWHKSMFSCYQTHSNGVKSKQRGSQFWSLNRKMTGPDSYKVVNFSQAIWQVVLSYLTRCQEQYLPTKVQKAGLSYPANVCLLLFKQYPPSLVLLNCFMFF